MTNNTQRLAELVTVDAAFKPSVQLPADFEHPEFNERLINSYIPTSDSIALFAEVARSLHANSTERARTLVGTYGTGKSDLLLMMCNYLSRSVDDPVMQPFYQRLHAADPTRHDIIYQHRANKPPFLIVLLQADPDTRFPGFVLHGLNQALERQGLSDVMATTKYDAAREQIQSWEREGHPLFQTFYDYLQNNEGKEIAGLLAELASPQADMAFPLFVRTFKKVTGTEFNVYSYSQPHDAFVNVTRTLRDRGTHSGIVLVCDEFTEFLRRYEKAIDQHGSEVDSETMAVQNVAERSCTSGPAQLHFLVASLESFAAASMESKSSQASKAIERVGGRFKHHALAIQASEELIKGTIRKKPDVLLLPNRQRDHLLDIAAPIWKHQGRTRDWVRDMIIEGCFPLHPLVTYALPMINRYVAQSQRTMFQFLKSDKGLMGFISQQQVASPFPDWHNLLTLDVLFDYFQESIETKKPDISDAYNHSLQSLQTAHVDTYLAARVLKVITFCEVVAPDTILSATRIRLHQALNLPPEAREELQTALDILEQVEAIYPPETESGIYSLPLQGRVSVAKLRRQVREEAHKLSTSVEVLQSKHPAEAIEAKNYNQQRGSHRELTAFYIGIDSLSQPARLKKDISNAPDALLWYVVATSNTERATAQSAARELTRQNEQLVIAVPTTPLEILGALRDYAALEKVRNLSDSESGAKAYLHDTGLIGKEYRSRYDEAIKALKDVRLWEWFEGGTPHIVQSQQKVYDVASKLIERLFPDTPPHTLKQHLKPDTLVIGLKRAVECIIKGDVQIAKTSKGAMETIIRSCAASFGILEFDRTDGGFEVYKTSEPSTKHIVSRKVWHVLHDKLGAKKSWASIVEELRNPPYGLYDSLLLVYLTTFITHYADSIEIMHRKAFAGRPHIDMELLHNLLARPQDYILKFQPLSEAERQWLRGIVQHGLNKSPVSTITHGKSLRASVAEQVQIWVKQLRLPVFAEQLTPEHIQEMIPDSSSSVLSPALLLIQRNTDLETALMHDIPQMFDAPADRTRWSEENANNLVARFAEVCRTLQDCPRALRLYLEKRIATLFGCEHLPPEQQWNAIYEWRQKKQVVNPTTLSTPTRTLFRLINDVQGSIEFTILNEYAKTIVGINTEYQRWSSLDSMTRLEQEIEKALQEIEMQWQEAAPGEEVWLNGLASEATGRPVASTSNIKVAKYLVSWAQGFSWPACVSAIDLSCLQQLYPDLETSQCQDITHLLQRVAYDASQWEAEVVETLSKQFGIQSWRKHEVQNALTRFAAALKHASEFDTLLRLHIVKSIASIFAGEQWLPASAHHSSVSEILEQWYAAHPIPENNDLSDDAHILLRHISTATDAIETILLSTLPRAFADIGQAYQQWKTCQTIDTYCFRVQQVVDDINAYEPLTYIEHDWLTGIVKRGLQIPLNETAWERRRLISIVAHHVHDWLDSQRLPIFCRTLGDAELSELFPKAETYAITTIHVLLTSLTYRPEHMEEMMATLLMETLPASLGQISSSQDWSNQDVSFLLERLILVCQLIRSLREQLEHHLYTSIGTILGIAEEGDTTATILAELRKWPKQHILLPGEGEKLSPNASALYETLQVIETDPKSALLFKLPRKIKEVRQSYDQWQTWQTRVDYIATMREAAHEIEERGRVGEATQRVHDLWQQFKLQFDALSMDERRWLIKAFNEEFQQ